MPRGDTVPTVHCLRISKTGSTTLNTLVVDNNIRAEVQGYRLVLHGHRTSMPEALQNPTNQVAFFLRDPLARFVSGFNHRVTEVPGRRSTPVNVLEGKVLKHFSTPNDLAEALSSSNEVTQDRAYLGMQTLMHARLHYTYWLVGLDYLQRRLHRIAFVGFLETYAQDVERFLKHLGIEREIAIPHERQAPATAPRELSDLGQNNLRRWYAEDIAIYNWLRAGRPSSEPRARPREPDVRLPAAPRIAGVGIPAQSDEPPPSTARPAATPVTAKGTRGFGFVLAGVQKAGTSSLFELIGEHPQVARPEDKEQQFFTKEKFNWRKPDYEQYNRSIQWKPSSVIAGEGTPRYLFWPQAMERIQVYNPSMRIILSFRDPIERAFSHWSMAKGNAGIEADFGQAIRNGWTTRWPRTAKEAGKGRGHTVVSRGFYGEQLEHALDLFDRGQFLLLDYHHVFAELGRTLGDVAAFLGVDPFLEMPTEQHVLPAPMDLVANAPTGQDVRALADLYASDLARFAELSGFDISPWPTSRVLAGTLDPGELAARLADRARLVAPDAARPTPPEAPTRRTQRAVGSSR